MVEAAIMPQTSAYDNALNDTDIYRHLERIRGRHYRQHGQCITFECVQAAMVALRPFSPTMIIDEDDPIYELWQNGL